MWGVKYYGSMRVRQVQSPKVNDVFSGEGGSIAAARQRRFHDPRARTFPADERRRRSKLTDRFFVWLR